MTKIVACLAVCNEEALIAESIRSVKAYVDGFVIIDSVFKSNPLNATHSSDLTRAIAERTCPPLPLKYIESEMKVEQPDARNRYLRELQETDWALVIDGDETLYGNHVQALAVMSKIRRGHWRESVAIPVFTTAINAHGLGKDMDPHTFATAPLINTVGYMARLFENRPGLHYKMNELGIPHGLYDKEERFAGRGANRTNHIFIVNHHTKRGYWEYVNNCVRELTERGKLPA